ncbi:hypothetical protein M0R04_06500 [Candidatus Dojkabacteria bacterium]|jgi:hypothetical protein|nr:hypothetical protein [Candidatus Dojkabacteria bacterium]
MNNIIKLYPERSSFYFEVVVFKTKNEMLQRIRKDGGTTANDTEAYCLYSKRLKRLGKIYFYQGATEADTVAHEMIHAVSGYMDYIGVHILELSLSKASEAEERFCRAVDGLIKQFYKKVK